MDLLNAVIVYFAFGVPFGVLTVYLRLSRVDRADIFRVFYHLVFWPGIVLYRSAASLRKELGPADIRPPDLSLFERGKLRRLRSKRSIVAGLVNAHRSAIEAADLELPFQACIEHPNPSLAAKCIQRRNIAKLERYMVEAQNDLSKSIAEIQAAEQCAAVSSGDSGRDRSIRDLC